MDDNDFLLFTAIMSTKGPAAETTTWTIITEFQDTKLIK